MPGNDNRISEKQSMPEGKQQCKYKGCEFECYSEGEEYCIFHMSKKTAEEIEALSVEEKEKYKEFEKQFIYDYFELLRTMEENPDIEKCDFRGFQFVNIDLKGNIYQKDVNGNWNYQISGEQDTLLDINGRITLNNELFNFAMNRSYEHDFIFSLQII